MTREEIIREMEKFQAEYPHFSQIEQAVVAELRKMDWQPIATLPIEGGPFLIYWPMTMVGHAEIDLCSHDEYAQIVGLGERLATHWMPLPVPPPNTEGGE